MAFKYRRRTAEELDQRANQSSGDFQTFIRDQYKVFKTTKGDNWIRILPPTWEGAKHYGYDVFVHYSIGPEKASVICNLKQYKKKCPICERRMKLEAKGTQDEQLIRSMKPSQRSVIWLVNMNEQKQGPVIWAMPMGCDRDIVAISKDKRDGTIFYVDDPDEGFDLFFTRTGEAINTEYVGWQVARKATSIEDKWLDFVEDNPIPDCLIQRSYDEVLELFTGGMIEEEESDARPSPRRERDRDRQREPEEPKARQRPSNEPEEASPKRSRLDDEADAVISRPRRAKDENDVEERPRTRKKVEEEPEPEEKPRRRRVIEDDDAAEDTPPKRSRHEAIGDDDIPFEKDRSKRNDGDAPVSSAKERAAALRDRLAKRRE